MRIVDEDRRAVALANALQAALRAFELFERSEHRTGLAAGTDRKSGRDQRVFDLEFADQRQPDRYVAAAMFELELLGEAVDPGIDQANALPSAVTLAADRDDAQAARPRGIDHGLRAIMVG